jgi:hypothetical protein
MVAVDVVVIEVLSCNNASMRYIFKGEKSANPPARARTKPAGNLPQDPPKRLEEPK